MHKYILNRVFYSKSISAIVSFVYIKKVLHLLNNIVEISSKNLIIKILAENTYNSGNNKSNNSPCRCDNFQNLNSRCSDRLNPPLQNDVVNLKKPVKEGNEIDFQIST